MVSKKVTLVNAQGFHMRPASVFATAMGKYSSNVTIKFNGSDYIREVWDEITKLAEEVGERRVSVTDLEKVLLDEYRSGKLGYFTLESPEEAE